MRPEDIEKLALGTTLDKYLPKIPTAEQTTRRLIETLLSGFELIPLGWSDTEGPVTLADEQRGAMHILGAPRQGKSKLLELLIRHGIDNGQGATLIDPTEGGQTAKDVLRYCASVGFEKVVYIDPADFLKADAVPCINPIKYNAPASAVADTLMSVLQTSWGQKEYSATPRIEKYLPALIAAVHATGSDYLRKHNGYSGPRCAVTDLVNFIDRKRFEYRQKLILSALNYYDPERTIIEAAFNNPKEWEGFIPTVNRFLPFIEPTMELMFGSTKGLNFSKLIRDRYLILVNLEPTGVLRRVHRVLIGTLILAQLQYTISRLRGNGWHGKHYVYVDECGLMATRQLADFLYYQPKSGLIFNFAHHSFGQFEDPYCMNAIRNTTFLKFMFWVGNQGDRLIMMKDLGYGGELSDREVSFTLDQTGKQEAAFRNNKKRPIKFRLETVPPAEISDEVYEDFKKKIYAQREFYRTPAEVRAEINHRFAVQSSSEQPAPVKYKSPGKQKSPAQTPVTPGANPQGAVGEQSAKPSPPADTGSNKGGTVFDRVPHGNAVLRPKEKGRKKPPSGRAATRKRNDNPPPAE